MLTINHDKIVADSPKQLYQVWRVTADNRTKNTFPPSSLALVMFGKQVRIILPFLLSIDNCY